jgi:hydrogenase maturation factor
VEVDRIPVFAETRKISQLLKIHPLGLIGSGSLLICCRKRYASRLERDLVRSGIPVSRIGEVMPKGTGIQAFKGGRAVRWQSFEVDEIARLFSRRPNR